MPEVVEWSSRDELLFRREVLVDAPERMADLRPMPPIDWCARMMTREHSAPLAEPYRGEERRKHLMARPRAG